MAALNSNDVPTAIQLAERAVEKTPDDAGFRALLGNAYFAAGRFASAEAAFKDSLTHLFEPAAGHPEARAGRRSRWARTAKRLRFLEAGRGVARLRRTTALRWRLPAVPTRRFAVLEPAPAQPAPTRRVRQNLALAYALAGDWNEAPHHRGAGRSRRPARRAHPAVDAARHAGKRASDQVAALVGVTPAAVDPGQPVRLALRKTDTQVRARPRRGPAPAPSMRRSRSLRRLRRARP